MENGKEILSEVSKKEVYNKDMPYKKPLFLVPKEPLEGKRIEKILIRD